MINKVLLLGQRIAKLSGFGTSFPQLKKTLYCRNNYVIFVDNGADITAMNKLGKTAFDIAMDNGKFEGNCSVCVPRLTHFSPVSHSIPSENVRKPLVFCRFQGV